MRSSVVALAAMLGLVSSLGLSVGPPSAHAQRYLTEKDPAKPRIRYADSLDSPNDRCMVRGERLNLHVRPVYANGVPLGFC